MPLLARRFLILLCCVLLFLCALPLSYDHLASFMYWTSLMSWPGYDPLLYHFPIFFDTHAHIWTAALLVAGLALAGLVRLMRDSGVRAVVLVVVCPVFGALAVQYAAITRLDDHVFWFFTGGITRGLPWFFDGSALLRCLAIAFAYSIAGVALMFVARRLTATKSPNQAMQRTAR